MLADKLLPKSVHHGGPVLAAKIGSAGPILGWIDFGVTDPEMVLETVSSHYITISSEYKCHGCT